ncbi:MAG: tetrahydrofolate dehydrogenase/cyclohydrolase catalytic domain-containing protein [Peptostreptococcus sp.]|uniref:bifunctional 5,10-methylenetetrahydrofolate dehydrogenase/5,10-methenyltetrahydrofolate cyclohydrolase n=1 Tax=Peptostreptococcus sp. TaxID=1262 RepID=UPI002FCC1E36
MLDKKLLLGKAVADSLTENIIKDVEYLKNEGVNPTLAMLKVGNREEDSAYQRGANSRCIKCGIEPKIIELEEDCSEEEYIKQLKSLNEDSSVHGILCFRPLPKQIREEVVEDVIDPIKDIDCFSPINMAKIISNDSTGYAPCTPKAVIEILDYYNINIEGENISVLGRSLVVGRPLAMLLINRNATVRVCHSKTRDIEKISQDSDILISCMGRAKMVNEKFVKKGAVLIDVGINFDEDGNMCGDVDFDSVIEKVDKITPVPRGVGSVTTSVLAKHLVKACKKLNNL